MQPSYGIVLVTTSSEAEGRAIAKALLTEHLAACVNLFPVQSLYIWENELNQDPEWQMVIKTDLNQFPLLEARILALHSYKVPEIVALPIVVGSTEYLDWMSTQVSSPTAQQAKPDKEE